MITIIRIAGMVNMNRDIDETFSRLLLKRKYSCTIINEAPEIIGMIHKIKDFCAYGTIDKDTLVKLIEKRGQPLDKKKKIDAEKIAEMILKNKNFDGTGIKPFFRLHPPRGGIDSRVHYPKGVLGDHKDKLNELVRRML